MKIKITKRSKRVYSAVYSADIIDLPGSPSLGAGLTIEEAIARVFLNNLAMDCYVPILTRLAKETKEIIFE